MKALSTMKFVVNTAEDITKYKDAIKAAETYEDAKRIACGMNGYINCCITFLNTMVCMENNCFTEEFDEVIEGWQYTMYQALVDKADETKQDSDLIWKLLNKRDEFKD